MKVFHFLSILIFLGLAAPSMAEVPIEDPAWLACTTDADCQLVDQSCGACCDNVAVNSAYAEAFIEAKKQSCVDYEGPVCACMSLAEKKCVEGKCSAIVPNRGESLEDEDK